MDDDKRDDTHGHSPRAIIRPMQGLGETDKYDINNGAEKTSNDNLGWRVEIENDE
jgi:hypothetical protein